MIFYSSKGEFNTDFKLLDDPQFNAQFAHPIHQQGFIEKHRVPADIWLNGIPKWSLFEQLSDLEQFKSIYEEKMGSLPKSYISGESSLENELLWFHRKSSDSSNPNPFSNQYGPYIDNERNNNINFKSQLLNFSMKNSDCYEEEDEKENLAWIPNTIQSATMSLSNHMNTSPLFITQKSMMSNEKNGGNPQSRCYKTNATISERLPYDKEDSTTLAHYSDEEWKKIKNKWIEDGELKVLQEQQKQIQQQPLHLKQPEQQQQEQQQLEDEEDVKEEEKEADESQEDEQHQEDDGEEEELDSLSKSDVLESPDEVDTLLTFLSKFDEKVAAIWGHKNENKNYENIIHTNPWNNNEYVTNELFNFQQIEDEHSQRINENEQNLVLTSSIPTLSTLPSLDISSTSMEPGTLQGQQQLKQATTKGKYNIMNSMRQYFGNAPPESEYFIIKSSSQINGQMNNLDVLNHSEEKSGFIKFIPVLKNSTVSEMMIEINKGNSNHHHHHHHHHEHQRESNEATATLREMLQNLDLDCDEEQEIIAACGEPKPAMLPDGPPEDLLTSWKTHFRTVIAQEVHSNNNNYYNYEGSSPTVAHSNPQLPEFRTEYNEKEYVLYQRGAAAAFQVRFKLCGENEKGNQTEDVSTLPEFSNDYEYDGQLNTPFIEYGKELSGWLGLYEEECGNGYEFDWSEGRMIDSCIDSFYDDSVYDDYDNLKVPNDNDSDFGQFHSFCFSNGPSNNNKQSKADRRRAKGRPCKYFFMDGSCRRGNECKFSHDLITCRFWAEGSCLKGETCPFLHCFLDAKDFESNSGLGHKIDTKYQLESESDFPALGSTKISSRVPIEDEKNVFDMLSQDDDGIGMLNKLEDQDQYEEQEANGWPHHENSSNNWICSLINVSEKRKKKKH